MGCLRVFLGVLEGVSWGCLKVFLGCEDIHALVVGDIINMVSILSIFGSSFTVSIPGMKLSIDTSAVKVQRKLAQTYNKGLWKSCS